MIARTIEVELSTADETATGISRQTSKPTYFILSFFLAPSDYTSVVSIPLIFTPSDPIGVLMCANITIIPDSVVENTESFQVFLNSSDPAVVLTQSIATVNISDSSGK